MTALRHGFALLAGAALAAGVPLRAQDTVAVQTRTEADGTATLVHELVVAAPAAEVWGAIATPEGWTSWAVPVAWWVEGDPEVLETSYDRAATPGSASTIRQRFLVRIPGRLLAFRTIKAPQGFPHWDSYRLVTSVFELEPAGAQTRVRLTSTGYPDSEAGRELLAFFTRGNGETLAALQRRFAGDASEAAARQP